MKQETEKENYNNTAFVSLTLAFTNISNNKMTLIVIGEMFSAYTSWNQHGSLSR